MAYSDCVTLVVPESMVEVARALSRALDPDVGGGEAFERIVDNEAVYTTPCIPEFSAAIHAFQAWPAALHATVLRDYSLRWPNLTPPTLAAVEDFCAAVTVTTGAFSPPDTTDKT